MGLVVKTDKYKLEELLTEFGVDYSIRIKIRSTNSVIIIMNDDEDNPNKRCIGYPGFYLRFEFDKQGKFIEMGAGE